MPRWPEEIRGNFTRAKANSDETYQGTPCRYGHPGIRMVRYHGKCLDCHRAKNTWYHREGSKEKRNAYELLNARNLLYLAAKSRARKKGREFSIELEDVQIPEKCPVTLKPLIPKTPDAPSIDRIDNTRGYIKGNVQVISKRANLAKNSLTIAELERLLGLIRSNMLS